MVPGLALVVRQGYVDGPLANRKPVAVAICHWLGIDAGNRRHPRPVLQPGCKFVDGIHAATGKYFDGAVRQISRITRERKLNRNIARTGAKENALDSPGNSKSAAGKRVRITHVNCDRLIFAAVTFGNFQCSARFFLGKRRIPTCGAVGPF